MCWKLQTINQTLLNFYRFLVHKESRFTFTSSYYGGHENVSGESNTNAGS
jgi:hypothetical protein